MICSAPTQFNSTGIEIEIEIDFLFAIDLIKTSKQFNRNSQSLGLGAKSTTNRQNGQPFSGSHKQHSLFTLGPFQSDDDDHSTLGTAPIKKVTGSYNLQPNRSRASDEIEHCAFDNPYFRDDAINNNNSTTTMATTFTSSTDHIQNQPASPTLRQRPASSCTKPYDNTGAHDSIDQVGDANNLSVSAGLDQRQTTTPTSNPNQEPLENFIEHHISNLHNRQVTTSVRELTILGQLQSHFVGFVAPNVNHTNTTNPLTDRACN